MTEELSTGESVLAIAITERRLPYDPNLRDRWRDPAWWEAGGWRSVLPEQEWRRLTKFKHQAAGGLVGYHFVEVLQMRALATEGLCWLYENYDLFRPPGQASKVFRDGDHMLHELFGPAKLAELRTLAQRYMRDGQLPLNPDLLAYRESPIGRHPVRFVEVKQNDTLRWRQLLGMALVQRVLGTTVEVVRYVEPGKESLPAATYQERFSLWTPTL
jgi:hypothetical protein